MGQRLGYGRQVVDFNFVVICFAVLNLNHFHRNPVGHLVVQSYELFITRRIRIIACSVLADALNCLFF